jgi:AraC-like DNA-binding protein
VREKLTLVRQLSASLGVRAWHNDGKVAVVGTSEHADIEIAWFDGGPAPSYAIGTRTMVPTRAAAIVIPAGIEHETTIAAGLEARVLGLQHAAVAEVADAMGKKASLEPTITRQDGPLVRLGQIIFDELVREAPGHELVLDALTDALCVELVRSDAAATSDRPPAEQAPRDPRVKKAIEFMNAGFREPLSLDTIAKAAGMSRFHFGRVFEKETGKSPYGFLIDLRVAQASLLLRKGQVSVTEAALSVGFNDLGRFGRAFRNRFGVTPREALAASRPKSTPARVARIA